LIEESLAHAPARNTPLEVIASRIEADLDRLRRHRPILAGRVDRAATVLIVHLSSPPRTRPIKCRVRKGGRRVYLVSSLTSGGVTYEVNPDSWTCSCPDFHRKGTGCKHGIASWALMRSAMLRDLADHVERIEKVNDHVQREAAHDDDDDEGEGPTYAEVEAWLKEQRWKVAKTAPDNPHSYTLRRHTRDESMFEAVVRFISEKGMRYVWWGKPYSQLIAGHYVHWAMSPPEAATLINRKDLAQVRKDELRNRGGGGIQWRWLHGNIEEDRAALRAEEAGQAELGGGV
jgi:hypothetical protein